VIDIHWQPTDNDHDSLSMAIEFSPLAATIFPTGGHFFLPAGGHEFPHQQIDWFVVC
jgi:hypothetical protein